MSVSCEVKRIREATVKEKQSVIVTSNRNHFLTGFSHLTFYSQRNIKRSGTNERVGSVHQNCKKRVYMNMGQGKLPFRLKTSETASYFLPLRAVIGNNKTND